MDYALTRILCACVVTLALSVPAWGAEIAHTFVEQNTAQTTTSGTYADITGASIASGNFTVGKKYLIYVTAQIAENSNGFMFIKTVHGSTDFGESVWQWHGPNDPSTYYAVYNFWTVWTAVSGEGIKLQHAVTGTTPTMTTDTISILAINLSDDVTENTDWFYNERTTDDSLSTTPTDGGSITFTPSAASDWLVLSHAQVTVTVAADSVLTRIVRSGEASSSTPQGRWRASTTSDNVVVGLARVFSLTAASNTFKEQADSTASSQTRLNSKIFALNLNKFKDHTFAYTDGTIALNAEGTQFGTQIQTASLTPSQTGDVWMGAYWSHDTVIANEQCSFRFQVDNVNQPAQGTQAFMSDHGGITTNEVPLVLSTVASLDTSSHTFDADGSNWNGSGVAQQRTIWGVSMELAPTSGLGGIGRRRNY